MVKKWSLFRLQQEFWTWGFESSGVTVMCVDILVLSPDLALYSRLSDIIFYDLKKYTNVSDEY